MAMMRRPPLTTMRVFNDFPHALPVIEAVVKPGHPPPGSGRPYRPTRSRAEMPDGEAEMFDDGDNEYRERDGRDE